MAEPGLLLAAGQPGLTLAFTNRLYVRTFIPEQQLGLRPVRVAARSSRRCVSRARTFQARVAEISPDAEFTPKQVETREERVNLVYAAKVISTPAGTCRSCPASLAEDRRSRREPPRRRRRRRSSAERHARQRNRRAVQLAMHHRVRSATS